MPFYEVVWPPWTPEENMMLVYFCSRGFELRDVTQIMVYKLHRAVRTDRQCINHMERFNQYREQTGHQRLCSDGMFDWHRAAVNDYIIRSTLDTRLLEDLLTFHRPYERLLREWRRNHVPLDEVLNVTHLRIELQYLLETHRSIRGHPSRFGGHYYR